MVKPVIPESEIKVSSILISKWEEHQRNTQKDVLISIITWLKSTATGLVQLSSWSNLTKNTTFWQTLNVLLICVLHQVVG